jgi:hypothetical protein
VEEKDEEVLVCVVYGVLLFSCCVGFGGVCVCFCMVVDWEVLGERWDRLLEEEQRERERVEKEGLEEERKKVCHGCCCEKAG